MAKRQTEPLAGRGRRVGDWTVPEKMRNHYGFSNWIKNPYADSLKKQIAIRPDDQIIGYFKNLGVFKTFISLEILKSFRTEHF